MSLTRRQLLASTAVVSLTGVVAGQAPAAEALAASSDQPGDGLPPGLNLETATVAELNALLGRYFAFVLLAGQRRPSEIYVLEQSCQRVRRWDVLGIKRLVPRSVVSLMVYAIARE